MITGVKVQRFIEDFKKLLKDYDLEIAGNVDPCDEGEYEVWLKEPGPDEEVKVAYGFMKGSYGDVTIDDYRDYKVEDDENWHEQLLDEW